MSYRGSVTKFWLGDETVPKRILSNNRSFWGKVQKFPHAPHEFSVQRPNFKLGLNLRVY